MRETSVTAPNLDQLAQRLATAFTHGSGAEALTPLLRLVLRLLARGRPVDPDDIAAATGRPPADVLAALRQQPSVEWDEAGRVVGLGLTLRPTPHRFEVDGRTLFTWCALDTLVFPALLGARHVAVSGHRGPGPGRGDGRARRRGGAGRCPALAGRAGGRRRYPARLLPPGALPELARGGDALARRAARWVDPARGRGLPARADARQPESAVAPMRLRYVCDEG